MLRRFSEKKRSLVENILDRFIKLKGIYSDYKPSQDEKYIIKTLKNLKVFIETIEKLLKEIEETEELLKNFIKQYPLRKIEIENIGSSAYGQMCYSGKDIVHFILSN